ncbi:hypothetical protein THAOC_05969, partial [Thalassiosira oceanica]
SLGVPHQLRQTPAWFFPFPTLHAAGSRGPPRGADGGESHLDPACFKTQSMACLSWSFGVRWYSTDASADYRRDVTACSMRCKPLRVPLYRVLSPQADPKELKLGKARVTRATNGQIRRTGGERKPAHPRPPSQASGPKTDRDEDEEAREAAITTNRGQERSQRSFRPGRSHKQKHIRIFSRRRPGNSNGGAVSGPKRATAHDTIRRERSKIPPREGKRGGHRGKPGTLHAAPPFAAFVLCRRRGRGGRPQGRRWGSPGPGSGPPPAVERSAPVMPDESPRATRISPPSAPPPPVPGAGARCRPTGHTCGEADAGREADPGLRGSGRDPGAVHFGGPGPDILTVPGGRSGAGRPDLPDDRDVSRRRRVLVGRRTDLRRQGRTPVRVVRHTPVLQALQVQQLRPPAQLLRIP